MNNRRIAYSIFCNVVDNGAYINLALKEGLSNADMPSASLITAQVYTAVEKLNYCDFLIKKYTKGRLHKQIRNILRLGIAELLFMHTPVYAVCNESVELAKKIGKASLSGFVNGVLRRINSDRENLPQLPSEPREYLNIKYGLPLFLADEYLAEYGLEFTEDMLISRHNFTTIRTQYPFSTEDFLSTDFENTDPVLADKKMIAGNILPDAIKIDTGFDVRKSNLFNEGRITIQSESAMLVCKICGVEPGMEILDACAAPGGKSAYLSSLMKNDGKIVACDVHDTRVALTRATLERLHVHNAECILQDASMYHEQFANAFDVVLTDVPCSGFGVSSKPDTFMNRSSESVDRIAALQYSIIDNCSKYVKPGGILVYSTCTISRRENEDIVGKFINLHDNYEMFPFASILPVQFRERAANGTLQLFPNMDETDGFFIARFKRIK